MKLTLLAVWWCQYSLACIFCREVQTMSISEGNDQMKIVGCLSRIQNDKTRQIASLLLRNQLILVDSIDGFFHFKNYHITTVVENFKYIFDLLNYNTQHWCVICSFAKVTLNMVPYTPSHIPYITESYLRFTYFVPLRWWIIASTIDRWR